MKKSWKYHKIMSMYLRHPGDNALWLGHFSTPEIGYLYDNSWELTEKLDGTNVRVKYSYINDSEQGEMGVGWEGRGNDSKLPWMLEEHLRETFLAGDKMNILDSLFPRSPMTVCLYGEGIGHGIGENGDLYDAEKNLFVLFDVSVDCNDGEKCEPYFLERRNVSRIAAELGIPSVPCWGVRRLREAETMVKEGKFKSEFGNFLAEGVVARPQYELKTRTGERVITKIKIKDYGLKII